MKGPEDLRNHPASVVTQASCLFLFLPVVVIVEYLERGENPVGVRNYFLIMALKCAVARNRSFYDAVRHQFRFHNKAFPFIRNKYSNAIY